MKKSGFKLIGISLLMFIMINILVIPINCYAMDNVILTENENIEVKNNIDNPSSNDLNIKYKSNENTIYIYWTVIKNAKDYEIEVDGKVYNTDGDTVYIHEKLKENTKHRYRLRAIGDYVDSTWSGYFEISTVDSNANKISNNSICINDVRQNIKNEINNTNSLNENSIPLTPKNLSSFSSQENIILTWDISKDAKEYEIEKDGVIVGNVSNTIYRDNNVEYGKKHSYRVRARNSLGVSEWSNYVEEKISKGFIKSPQDIKLVANNKDIMLSWSSIGEATGYEIEIDGNTRQIVSDTSFTHEKLNDDEVHYYRIRAIKNDLLGNWSKLYFGRILNNQENKNNNEEDGILKELNNDINETNSDKIENNQDIVESDHKNEDIIDKKKYYNNLNSDEICNTKVYEQDKIKENNSINKEDGVLEELSKDRNEIDSDKIENNQEVIESNEYNENIVDKKRYYNNLSGDKFCNQDEIKENEEINCYELVDKIRVPENINTSSTENSISLCWDEVTGAMNYEIEVDGIISSTEDNHYTISNLQAGTSYGCRIRAISGDEVSEWSELVKVYTTISNLYINEDMILNKDIICDNLYINSGKLNLNGYKLIVLRNAVQNNSSIVVDKGNLIINGNYDIIGNSSLKMCYEDGYILVNGNFLMNSENNLTNLSNGVLEVKGNVTQKTVEGYNDSKRNFNQSMNFILKISGNRVSTIETSKDCESEFNIIDTSESAGIVFNNPIKLNRLDDLKNVKSDITIYSSRLILDKDLVYDFNVKFENSFINLNNHKLVIEKKLIQNDTSIYINNGKLFVNGDYSITGESILKMNSKNAYVLVNENFLMNSKTHSYHYLTDGILEVKGNVTQQSVEGCSYSKRNFDQYENFILKISGNKVSTIETSEDCESEFNIIDTSESAGIIFKSPIRLKILSNLKNVKGSVTIYSSKLTLDKDLICDSNVIFEHSFIDLNNHKLFIAKNLVQKDTILDINKGNLIINGNYDIIGNSSLRMWYIEGYILVNGDFLMNSQNKSGGLEDGVLEVKGNVTQKSVEGYNDSKRNFDQKGTFILKISGNKVSTIVTSKDSITRFNIIDSSKSAGIIFKSSIRLNWLNSLKNVKSSVTIYSSNIKLNKDLVCDFNIILKKTNINLNNHKLVIGKNLIQNDSGIVIGNGKLTVNRNYSINGNSFLRMQCKNGYVLVNGNFLMNSKKSSSQELVNGILEVKGNVTQKSVEGCNDSKSNFDQGINFILKISGNKVSTIMTSKDSITRFNIIDSSKSAGIIFKSPIEINELDDLKNVKSNITICCSFCDLDKDVIFDFNLILDHGTNLHLNNHKLVIGKNLIQKDSYLDIRNGKLIVNGNYSITGLSQLDMRFENGYVLVNGNFFMNSKESSCRNEECFRDCFVEGVLEVKGNITQRSVDGYSDSRENFKQAENFILKISGEKVSKIFIENPYESMFNILDISESVGVIFNSPISLNKLYDLKNVQSSVTIYSSNLSLDKDVVIGCNVILENTIINLNDYKLVIVNDLLQNDSTINIHNGDLIVNGDYSITGLSTLFMDCKDGYILVNRNFLMNSKESSYRLLRAGILEVKGNVTQQSVPDCFYSTVNFYQCEDFILKISGNKVSIIKTSDDCISTFNIIDSRESAGVEFKNPISAYSVYTLENIKGDVIIRSSSMSLNRDAVCNCNIILRDSSLDLNGYKLVIVGNLKLESNSYIYTNNGRMLISKNLLQDNSNIKVNDGKLIINGDYSVIGDSSLIMQDKNGYVLVNRNFLMNSKRSSSYNFIDGVLEVKGNVTQKSVSGFSDSKGNFDQIGDFTLKISGDKVSEISIQNPYESSFSRIYSKKCAGVKFTTKIRLKDLSGLENVKGTVNLYSSNIELYDYYNLNFNLTLTKSNLEFNDYDLNIDHKLTLVDSTLKLNGAYLFVGGDLKQKGGTVDISGGHLNIGGNYFIYDKACFIMTNEDDYVYVSGNFTIQTSKSEKGKLTNGVLAVKGDFTQKGNKYSFAASGEHLVIFVGNVIHNVTLSNSSKSNFERVDFEGSSCINFIDLEGCTVGSVLKNFFLGLKDSIVESYNDLWDTLRNLDKIPESIAFIVKALLPWRTEQSELINQLSETIEGFINEMYFSNANIIARKVGKIVGDIIISIIVDKGVKFVVKGLKGLIKSDKLATILNKIDNVDDTGKISDDTAKEISDDIDVEIRSNAYITGGVGNLSRREELLAKVSNQKLKNCINEMYRKGATIGDGGLADAVRYELKTGELVGGKSHMKKAVERVKNLENIINKQNLSKNDLDIAQRLLDDLKNAINGK